MLAASGAGQLWAGTTARLQQGQGHGYSLLLHCAWLFLGKKMVVHVVSGCVACPVVVWGCTGSASGQGPGCRGIRTGTGAGIQLCLTVMGVIAVKGAEGSTRAT